MKCRIYNNAKFEGLDELAKNLYDFAHERFKFSKPVTVVFESNVEHVGKVFAPTGHYDPQLNRVVIYVDHRHPKDILRSMAHELIHHKQNCDGHFAGGVDTKPGYAQRDPNMRKMEIEAYREGNEMLFRDFENTYNKGGSLMSENKEKVEVVSKDEILTLEMFETSSDVKGGMSTEAKKEACVKGGGEWIEDHTGRGHCSKPVSEEVEASDKEWYNSQLNEALLKKFKIKK